MSDFKHTRTVPPEWPELLAYAEHTVPADVSAETTVDHRIVRPLLRRSLSLSDEQRGANEYYALGEVMCRMSQLLRENPKSRQRLVVRAALGMFGVALQRRADTIPLDEPFVPVVDDLLDDAIGAMQAPFLELAKAAQQQVPGHQRVLTDTLSAAVIYRRRKVHGSLWERFIFNKQYFVRLAAAQGLAAARITDELLTGATRVLRVLLTGNNPTHEPSDEMLAMPLDADVVRRAWNPTAYTCSALLRLDEFLDGMGWQGTGDSLYFDRSVLNIPPRPRSHSTKSIQLHENRNGCPAAKANGMAHQVARYLLPDIIATAQQIIPGKLFEVMNQSTSE